jgi:uncharacterized membrane protein YagU involved in acid resistance
MVGRALAGVIGGTVATVPMTAAMEGWHALLPATQRYALPPRRIEDEITRRAGARWSLDESEHLGLTMLLHFGFGGAAGAVYGLVAERLPGPAPIRGVGFGLAVWATSYLCGLPILDLERNAVREPAPRNAMMIAAHVVWGAALGMTFAKLREGDGVKPVRRSSVRPRPRRRKI